MRWLLLIAALLAASPSHADPNRRRGGGRQGATLIAQSGGSTPLPLVLRDDTYFASLLLWAHTNYSTHMWEEDFSDEANNHADTDGDSVGQIDDPSPGSHLIQWQTSTRRGVLRSEAVTGISYVELRAAGNNDFANVQDSQRSFMNCHGTAIGGSRNCTVIWIGGVPTDAASYVLFDNFQGSGANVGFEMLRTAANRIQVLVGAGTGAVCNHTTSASADLVAADGIMPVGWRVSGNTVQINVGAATEEGFTCTGAGSPAAATDELTIGGSSAGTGTSNSNFAGLLIFDRALSDVEYAAVVADLMSHGGRSSRSLLREVDAADGYYNFASQILDFTDPLSMASDTTHTTTVTTINRRIASVRDPRDQHNLLGRAATSTATDYAPRWVGDSGAEWVGTAPQSLVWAQQKNRGGATTVIAEVEQDKLTFGSHWCEGAGYGTQTGADYIDNPGGVPYWVIHTTSGSGATAPLINGGVGFSIMEAVRNASAWLGTTSGQGSNAATNGNAAGCGSIGRENVIGTRMDGRIRRIYQFNINLSAAQIARVRAGIEADSEYTNGDEGFVFSRAFVAGLGPPWDAVLGQGTAAGASLPFTVTPTVGSPFFTETGGIDWMLNTDAGSGGACPACVAPTLSYSHPDYTNCVSGESVLQTCGFFTTNFGTASPRPFSVAAGFVRVACWRYATNVLGDRGGSLMATNYDTVNFEPRQAENVWGYAHDSGDAVADGWHAVTDTNTGVALGVDAPRDASDYCSGQLVEAGATTGAMILLRSTDNGDTWTVAHRADAVTLPSTGTYLDEENASPGPLLGAPQVAHTFRLYSIRGWQAYAP
jgi:hypothetical protein